MQNSIGWGLLVIIGLFLFIGYKMISLPGGGGVGGAGASSRHKSSRHTNDRTFEEIFPFLLYIIVAGIILVFVLNGT